MLSYQELIELRDQLVNDEIRVEVAKERCWKDINERSRSWYTKEWKERRLKFLKDKCQICGSKETLTVQHLSHPRKYNEYLSEITRDCTIEYRSKIIEIDKVKFKNYVLDNQHYSPVPLCPKCNYKNPSVRVRKKPKFRCPDCKHEFEEAKFRYAIEIIELFLEDEDAYESRDKCFESNDKWSNILSLSNIKYRYLKQQVEKEYGEIIEKEAFLQYINANIKYRSFENAITACKRCASSRDLYGRDLCPKCKTNYKETLYPTCIKCLPDEKRKSIEEQVEFNNKMDEIQKNLGID